MSLALGGESGSAAADLLGPSEEFTQLASITESTDWIELEAASRSNGADSIVTRRFPVAIADGSAQGDPLWWYLQLAGSISITSEAASEGSVYLAAALNDAGAASVRWSIAGDQPVRWRSVDYEGHHQHKPFRGQTQFAERNAVPNGAVRPGVGEVSLTVVVRGTGIRARVGVDPVRSGVEISNDSPYDLSLDVDQLSERGGEIAITFTVTNSDRQAASGVVVTVDDSACGCQLVKGPPTIELGEVVRTKSTEISLVPGASSGRVLLIAEGVDSNDFAYIEFAVPGRGHGGSILRPAVTVGVAMVLAASIASRGVVEVGL